jgi:hypothetical protein
VLLRELPDELIVYDLRRHRAHCLNRAAARVFRSADGTRTVAEIAEGLEGEPQAREAVVRLALDQLAAAGLLVTVAGPPADASDPLVPQAGDATGFEAATRVEAVPARSRREVLQSVGTGVALLLPAVVSVLAPTPADAASCLDSCPPAVQGQPCKCLLVPQQNCGTCQLDGTCDPGGGGSC